MFRLTLNEEVEFLTHAIKLMYVKRKELVKMNNMRKIFSYRFISLFVDGDHTMVKPPESYHRLFKIPLPQRFGFAIVHFILSYKIFWFVHEEAHFDLYIELGDM